MNPTPKGWPRLSTALFYDKPGEAIDWMVKALGFEVRIKIDGEGEAVVHSELTFGEAVVMVVGGPKNPPRPEEKFHKTPSQAGGVTQSLMLYVDDVDAHHAKVAAAGATIFAKPEDHDYGPEYWTDRSYGFRDPGGHHWWISQRMRG